MIDPLDRVYEQLLVVRCQTGDEAAFGELVTRYAGRLRGFVGGLLAQEPAALEDVLQDVWLDVVRGVARLREPAAFPAWVFRVARDRAFRALRGRRPALPLIDTDPPATEPDFTPDDAAMVRAGLDALDPHHREVLWLRYVEELTYDAIAGVVGCPVGTVRSRLHHAKRALKSVLEQRGMT